MSPLSVPNFSPIRACIRVLWRILRNVRNEDEVLGPLMFLSRHTVVCCAAQEAGAPHREYIDRKNENVIFTPLYLGDHVSDWNQICYTVARQPRESTFQI